MAEADIQATMDELYAAYVQGDFDRLSSLMDESIEWMIYAPVTVFPFAGPRRGRAAAVQTMREIAQAYAIESYQREIVTVKGERVAVVADVRMRQRATQRMLRFRVANFMRFEDGRLVEFREFINSFDLAEQALGRELAL
ncbi:MAG: nuclear transport factor 2 family protein [Pseudolabrys sp.]|jgi:ketosteroid isomerase-like protein